MSLIAPFPYYGGKRRPAPEIWRRFGYPNNMPDVYAEPFFGSGAVLLHNDLPCKREIVCDLDGHVANVWRALRDSPDEVAYWADWPTIHQDLTARHRWLVDTAPDRAQQLTEDPHYSDAKAAGWWLWGISNWIGSGWCQPMPPDQIAKVDHRLGGEGVQAQRKTIPDQIAKVGDIVGGRGVQAQRRTIPDKRPHSKDHPGGVAVQPQRTSIPDQRPHTDKAVDGGSGVQARRASIPDKRPMTHDAPSGRGVQATRGTPSDQRPYSQLHPGGVGVQTQRLVTPSDKRPHAKTNPGGQGVQPQRPDTSGAVTIGSGERLLPWFHAIAQRLARVVVLNRTWSSAVTPTLLCDTKSNAGKYTQAIFLDPPYKLDDRTKRLYGSDLTGESPADAAWQWALEHGERYRIAYAAHEGDYELPAGWTSFDYSMSGRRSKKKREMIYFSPACIDPDSNESQQSEML